MKENTKNNMKIEYDHNHNKIKECRTEDITIKYSDLDHAKFNLPPELKLTYAEPLEDSSCWMRRPNTDDLPSVDYIIDEAVNHYLTQVVYKDLNFLEIGYVLPTFNYISTPSDLINKAPKKVTKFLWGFMLEKTAEVHFESWSLTVRLSIQTSIKRYDKSTRRPKRYKSPVLTTRAKRRRNGNNNTRSQ